VVNLMFDELFIAIYLFGLKPTEMFLPFLSPA